MNYSKSTLSSFLNKSRSLNSILILKQMQTGDKTNLLRDFNKSIKDKYNSRDVLLVAIEI